MSQENVGYGVNQKILHQGSGGTIPALADEELMGEDDDYDDLYSDVNVGEGFFQAHQQAQTPAQVGGAGSGSIQAQNSNVSEPRMAVVSGGAVDGKYQNDGGHNGVSGPGIRSDAYPQGSSFGAKGINVDVQSNKVIPQGSTSIVLNTQSFSGNAVNVPEPPVHNPYGGAPHGAQQIPVSQTNVNPNAVVNRSPTQPFVVDNGNTMLFVGELHWWTTDAEIESVLSQYGRVKEIKFFDERVSGKSKGYCQVEFYDSAAAAACKEGMNGFVFNGKACVVAFASPETLKQMGANFTGRNQGQNQMLNRRPLNEGVGRGNNNYNNNTNTQNGDGGRNYGRGGFARGGQGMGNRGGHWGGAVRGRGINNMANGAGAGPYGPGLAGPSFGGMMHPQGMMGAGGFDPTFMGRGGGYGGFPGLAYPGMPPSYPGVNAMGMVGIAPHVNPAFFGGAGMGTMGNSGMNGVHAAGMWNEASGGGGGGGEEGGSEYGGYEDENQEKEEKPSRDKERATTDRDWSESSGDRRHKSHREEKDSHREYRHQRDRDSEEYERGQSSSKSRSRSRMSEDDHRSRSRDADYGKRRRGD